MFPFGTKVMLKTHYSTLILEQWQCILFKICCSIFNNIPWPSQFTMKLHRIKLKTVFQTEAIFCLIPLLTEFNNWSAGIFRRLQFREKSRLFLGTKFLSPSSLNFDENDSWNRHWTLLLTSVKCNKIKYPDYTDSHRTEYLKSLVVFSLFDSNYLLNTNNY